MQSVQISGKARGGRYRGKFGKGAASSFRFASDEDMAKEKDKGGVARMPPAGTEVSDTDREGVTDGEDASEAMHAAVKKPAEPAASETTPAPPTPPPPVLPVGGTSRDFTAIVELTPTASRDAESIRLGGELGIAVDTATRVPGVSAAESRYVVDGANISASPGLLGRVRAAASARRDARQARAGFW